MIIIVCMRKFILAGFVCIFLLVVICTAGCVGNFSVFSDPIVGTWDPESPYDTQYYYNEYTRYVFESDGTGTEYFYDDFTFKSGTYYYNIDDLIKKIDLTWKVNETDKGGNIYYTISYNGYSNYFDDEFKIRFSPNDNSKTLIAGSHDYIPSTTGDIINPGNAIISVHYNGKLEEDILGLWYRESDALYYKKETYNFEADGTGTHFTGNLGWVSGNTFNFTWQFRSMQNGGGEGIGGIGYERGGSDDFELKDSQLYVDGLRYYKSI